MQESIQVDPYQIIRHNKTTKVVTLGGKALTEQEIKQFKSDINVIRQLPLWKVLQESTKQYAIDWALTGTPLNDEKQEQLRHLTGKMWLECLTTQQNIIKILDELA